MKNELVVLAAGTVMPTFMPKELGKRLTECGQYKFWCLGGHHLEGPQTHPLPEQLPPSEESHHGEQACGGNAHTVDCATPCG